MSAIFDGIPHTDRQVPSNGFLFHQGDPVRHMFVVVEGEVQMLRRLEQGQALILQRGLPGTILAEASLFSDRYHCDAVAMQAARVRCFARKSIRSKFETDASFAMQWATHLAQEVRSARFKAEVLSHQKVSDRLDLWLAQNDQMPDRGLWKQVAFEIGASPEALYRELARRRPKKGS